MKQTSIFFLLLITLSTVISADENLIFSAVITRHGDRAPFISIKNTDYNWGVPPEQLTALGMQQEYTLGQQLRRRYIDRLKLLKPAYIPDSIYALSSDTNRTIESAICLLTGLYPLGTGPKLPNGEYALPSGLQPIPLRTLPKTNYLLLTQYQDYLKILAKYIYPSPAWRKKEAEYHDKFKGWSRVLGNELTNLAQVIAIGDVLIVARNHNQPLPQGLSTKAEAKIIELTNWGLTYEFKNPAVAFAMGGELFKQLAEDLTKAASAHSTCRLKLYSAHDITILPLLSLLGAPLAQAPGYAAHIEYELYATTDSEKFRVRIRYNNTNLCLPFMAGKDYANLKDFLLYCDRKIKESQNLSESQ